MKKPKPLLSVTALAALLACNLAAADKLAFLVGNQNYQNDKPLRNPGHDVELLAERLRQIGFTVLPPLYNQSRTGLIDGLRALHDQIKPGDTVLVYFSGHGLQYQDDNYLVPVDANIALATEIPDEALGGSRVLSYLEEAGVKIVILDACRNNPYRSAGKGIGKGLGRQDASAVNNTLLAFAAAPGKEAQDGSGQYSPYAQALADAIVQPGQSLEQVFKTVRKTVRLATRGEQEPWYNASLDDDLYLAGKPSSPAQPITVAAAQAEPIASTPLVVKIEPPKPSTDRYGINMIPVTGSCYQMGSPANEAGRDDNERQHEVCVGDFKLGETEVTQGQWRALMGDNPSYFKNCGDDCPVENVSWRDAQAFIAKLNGLTGQDYRLPSEAEWEYAARAGTTTPFSFGDNITPEQANFDGNYPNKDGKKGLYRHAPVPVKSLPASLWGLYEMHGNVREWTGTEWQESYDGKHEKESISYAMDSDARVVRGGSWYFHARYVRSASRDWNSAIHRNYDLGLRLAQD